MFSIFRNSLSPKLLFTFIFTSACVAAMASPVFAQSGKASTDSLAPGETKVVYSSRDVQRWLSVTHNGKAAIASPAVGDGVSEINLHRVTVNYSGTGKVSVAVTHAPRKDLQYALSKGSLRGYPQSAPSGRQRRLSSPIKNDRYAWVVLMIEGEVAIDSVEHIYYQSKNTLYGHVPVSYKFAGGQLPVRLMTPFGMKENPGRLYPLVISVAGSGSVGTDNVKNMEIYTLAQHLFTRYYDNDDLACFSVVPQIPPTSAVPEPYYPAGEKGRPTPQHPDWPMVNADGWFTQATIAFVKELINETNLPIDPDRIYFTGFSYGGKACWEFLKADPQLFAGAISVAGWPVGQAYSSPTGPYLKVLRDEVQIYKDVPVAIYAGSQDRMRFGCEAVYKCLKEAGATVTYTEIENADHLKSAGQTWAYTKNIAWLFSHKRGEKADK